MFHSGAEHTLQHEQTLCFEPRENALFATKTVPCKSWMRETIANDKYCFFFKSTKWEKATKNLNTLPGKNATMVKGTHWRSARLEDGEQLAIRTSWGFPRELLKR